MPCNSLICWGSLKEAHIFRLVIGCCPHVELSLPPAKNLGYPLPTPSILSTFHTLPLGVWQEKGFLGLPHICQPAPGRTAPHQAPALVGAPGQIKLLHLPIMEGYVLGGWQGCSLVGPCSASCSAHGTSSSIGPDFGKGCRHPDGP